jgi:hypothetical protein
MRDFESGRRIDAYDVRNNGKLLYQIDLDHFAIGLCRDPGKTMTAFSLSKAMMNINIANH